MTDYSDSIVSVRVLKQGEGRVCDTCRVYEARVAIDVRTAKQPLYVCLQQCLTPLRMALKSAYKELLLEAAHSRSERRRLEHQLKERGHEECEDSLADRGREEGEAAPDDTA